MSSSLSSISRASISRRGFLAGSGAAVASTTLGTRMAFASPENPSTGDVIVLVFLRGGADGLSLVAPYQMPSYRDLRPTLRVKAPDEVADPANAGLPLVSGGAVGAFSLSGTFAMHPGLASLHQGAWTDGDLAIVHAAGMPATESATRSHFDAMRNMEVGTAGFSRTDGFLNRFVAAIGATDRIAAVGRGTSLQRSLTGAVPAFSMNTISSFGVSGFASNTQASNTLARWYDADAPDQVGRAGATTLGAASTVRSVSWSAPGLAVQNGATYPWGSFGTSLREVAQLIRANIGLRVACIDLDGWDTHGDMGAPEVTDGYFRRRSKELADGLSAFRRDLGGAMSEVTVVTVSEFGRSISENSTGGVDHGRATAMMVMGGGVVGGVYGPFVPTITDGPEDDLTVLTDYRTVLAEVLTARGGAPDARPVFPTWTPTAPLGFCTT